MLKMSRKPFNLYENRSNGDSIKSKENKKERENNINKFDEILKKARESYEN